MVICVVTTNIAVAKLFSIFYQMQQEHEKFKLLTKCLDFDMVGHDFHGVVTLVLIAPVHHVASIAG
jgi:hypothetical protein